jgi:fatty-acyl-CoA synthase
MAVNLASFLEHHARVHGARVAVLDGEATLDYATLNRRADRLANALAAQGAGPGDRIAVRLPNGHRYLECLFACAKAGLVLAPVDVNLVADEVEHVLRDSGAGVYIDGSESHDALVEGAGEAPSEPEAGDDDPLLLMYTSGTTGRPKGVSLSHLSVLFTSFNQIVGWRLTADERALVVAPFHHVGGLVVLGLPCLHVGGSVRTGIPDPAAVIETAARDRTTAVFLSPHLWRRVAEFDDLESHDLSSIRLCASGGDPVPTASLQRLLAAFGAGFTDAYGLTEAASVSTLLPADDILRKAGSAGLPCTHNRLRVLGPDGTEAVPEETGDLVQAGPTVMRGYWQRPEETGQVLRNGWLHTGDKALVDGEGYLYIAGRSKDVIVSAGAKIYPSEIERVLREHPEVADAAVIGIPDDRVGEAVVAVVTLRAGVTLAPDEIVAFCKGRIADYKRPTQAFLSDALPRNASGKVKKGELRAAYGGER